MRIRFPEPIFAIGIIAPLLMAVARAAEAPPTVEQWNAFELAMTGPIDGNPFVDVLFSARFVQGDDTISVPGFYDGEGTYRIRFAPPAVGEWNYLTQSNRPGLDGKRGSFVVAPARGANHGPVRVYHTFHFAYADGRPYFPVGTTCYAWIHQPEELQEQTLKTLAQSPFNKLRMCIFPKSYVYNQNEPSSYAFVHGSDGHFDFTRFDPNFWRHLQKRIDELGKLGIEADLILFHPYDRWGFASMDKGADDRYIRYAIARLSACPNVWWSLANEYDIMMPGPRRPKGSEGNKSPEDWDRFFRILRQEDPQQHLRGVHQMRTFYNHAQSWVTHASIQRNGDLRAVLDWRAKYQKPIVIDECGYEGDIPNGWGKLSGAEMVRRFWIGTLSGGYVGHGETFLDPRDILWWSKGGVLHGQSPPRIAFLRKTMEALPYTQMIPSRLGPDTLVLSEPGRAYLVYAIKSGPIELTLDGKDDYRVDAINPWDMAIESLPNVHPGVFRFDARRGDFLLRITCVR